MLTIQDVGMQILGDNPLPLYIFGGTEYGIKDKYIEHLGKLYGQIINVSSFSEAITPMQTKQLVPVPPAVYVVRYDEQFVADIDEKYATKILKTNIRGTIVCVYELDKAVTKLNKYLPNNTVTVDSVNPKFVSKYLHQDFPKLDDKSIETAVKYSSSYGHARTMCKSLCYGPTETLAKMNSAQIAEMLGSTSLMSEQHIRIGIASKNFASLLNCISNYDGDIETIIYTIMQTMIDLEKIKSSKYSDSPLKDYSKYWTIQDIYNMFMHAYAQLDSIRSGVCTNIEDTLIYLFGIAKFVPIPSVEVMKA